MTEIKLNTDPVVINLNNHTSYIDLNTNRQKVYLNGYNPINPPPVDDWILATGFWNDLGLWYDTSLWID